MGAGSKGSASSGKRSRKAGLDKIPQRWPHARQRAEAPTIAGSRDDEIESPVLRRFRSGYRWDGIPLEPYKLRTHRGGEFCGASRQVLIGHGGEQVRFHVRYFELAPGGFTSLERHRHSHVVIGLRGRGRVRVGNEQYLIGRMDTIYVAPGEPHQLAATGRGPFGFLCIVDARRDRPRPVAE